MSGPYPSHAEIVARRRAEHRARLVAAARAADAAARAHGLRLLVFGSLAAGEVHENSDLDVALDGPSDLAIAACGKVWNAACSESVDCDVVILDGASESLRERVQRDGRDVRDLD